MDAPVLRSAAEPSDRYAKEHTALVDELRGKLATAALGGPEKARQRHVDRGKLLPRERVDTLVDPGSPFLELSPLAAWGSDYRVLRGKKVGDGTVELIPGS